MDYFAGLDVSVKETSVCIVDDAGKIVREARVASEPEALLQVLTNILYRFTRLWHLLPTLQDWCRHHPCKARFRLAGSPLPGGSRTLWIATKGFRSQSHPPFLDLSWRKGSFISEPPFTSFYHLVGGSEQLVWHREAERLGGHDTDDKLVLGWHLNRQVAWLCAPENGRHVMRAGAAIGIGIACAVAHQTAGQDKLANAADRRHTMTRGECRQLPAPVVEQDAVTDKQCAGARLNDGRKGSIDFPCGLRIQGQELMPEFASSGRHLFVFHFETRTYLKIV